MMEDRRKFKILKLTIFTAAVFGLGFFAFSGEARAFEAPCDAAADNNTGIYNKVFWITKSGKDTDNGTTRTLAKATFTSAINLLTPGDTLCIGDGTYTEQLAINKNGSSTSPITIIAENDGGAVIDTTSLEEVASVAAYYVSHIEVVGLKIISANFNIAAQHGKDVKFRKVTMYGTYTGQLAVFFGSSSATSNEEGFVLEDAYIDTARAGVEALWNNYSTMRRVVSKGGAAGMFAYNANFAIIENSIHINGKTYAPERTPGVQANSLYATANDNKFLGNITYAPSYSTMSPHSGFQISLRPNYPVGDPYCPTGVANNIFKDNVSINAKYDGGSFTGDSNLMIQNNSVIWTSQTSEYVNGFHLNQFGGCVERNIGGAKPPLPVIDATIINNSIFTAHSLPKGKSLYKEGQPNITVRNDFNNYYGEWSSYVTGTNNDSTMRQIDPQYNIQAYGNGAYLMVPPALENQGKNGADIGAEVLYQYENGILMNGENGNPKKELWPWPMEERICAETGYSVTYENGYAGCAKGGGLWKTLDGVYKNPADVDGSGSVNIKDIQACIKVITGADTRYQNQCRVLAAPETTTNIKDIQVIVSAIVNQ